MYSLFLDSADASVTVNGRALKGKIVERDFADTKKADGVSGVFGKLDGDGVIDVAHGSCIESGR